MLNWGGVNLVSFWGSKYGDDKKEFYEKADLFAFPTFYHNEAFPLVILEAMEHKLPVISTNVGGIPDEVVDGENGFIVEAKQTEQLANAISKLLCDESLRKKMGERGYQLFLKSFTEEQFEICMSNCLMY